MCVKNACIKGVEFDQGGDMALERKRMTYCSQRERESKPGSEVAKLRGFLMLGQFFLVSVNYSRA